MNRREREGRTFRARRLAHAFALLGEDVARHDRQRWTRTAGLSWDDIRDRRALQRFVSRHKLQALPSDEISRRRDKAARTEVRRLHRDLHSLQRLFPADAEMAILHGQIHELFGLLEEEPTLSVDKPKEPETDGGGQ